MSLGLKFSQTQRKLSLNLHFSKDMSGGLVAKAGLDIMDLFVSKLMIAVNRNK